MPTLWQAVGLTRALMVLDVGVLGLLCITGCLGNLLALLVFRKDKHKIAMTYYLMALAVADGTFLLYMFTVKVLPGILLLSENYDAYILVARDVVRWFWPVGCMIQMFSTFLVVMVTVDRYTAICKPFKMASMDHGTRVRRTLVVIAILSVLWNIPRFFHDNLLKKDVKSAFVLPINGNLTTVPTTALHTDNQNSLPSAVNSSGDRNKRAIIQELSETTTNSASTWKNYQESVTTEYNIPELVTIGHERQNTKQMEVTVKPIKDFPLDLPLPFTDFPILKLDEITGKWEVFLPPVHVDPSEQVTSGPMILPPLELPSEVFTLPPVFLTLPPVFMTLPPVFITPNPPILFTEPPVFTLPPLLLMTMTTPKYVAHGIHHFEPPLMLAPEFIPERISMVTDPENSTALDILRDESIEIAEIEVYHRAGIPLQRSRVLGENTLGNNKYFQYIYYMGLTWLVMYVVPLGNLLVLNVLLILALRKARHEHARLTQTTEASTKETLSTTINIIAVVTVFLVCQTPDFVQVVISYAPVGLSKSLIRHSSSACLCFLALNSGVNFIIYCMFYEKFRKIAACMLCCRKMKHNKEMSSASGTPIKTSFHTV